MCSQYVRLIFSSEGEPTCIAKLDVGMTGFAPPGSATASSTKYIVQKSLNRVHNLRACGEVTSFSGGQRKRKGPVCGWAGSRCSIRIRRTRWAEETPVRRRWSKHLLNRWSAQSNLKSGTIWLTDLSCAICNYRPEISFFEEGVAFLGVLYWIYRIFLPFWAFTTVNNSSRRGLNPKSYPLNTLMTTC